MNHHQINDSRKEQMAFIRKQILNLSQQLMKEQHFFKTFGYSVQNYYIDIAPSEIKKQPDIAENKLLALSIQTMQNLDVAPTSKQISQIISPNKSLDLKLKWKKLYRTIKKRNIEENKSAYLIQTIWKRVNGKSDSEFTPPDLHMFFHLDLEDYQHAELQAVHDMSDNILHLTVQSILYENEQEFEEEEEEGGLEEEAEADTEAEEETDANTEPEEPNEDN